MRLPERVTICEVGTRDGFQIEPEFIPTAAKIEVVDRLAEAGVPQIEVTSFVHPRIVPQMRDAEAVMAGIRRRPGTSYSALVPNDKGAVRAVDAGADELRTVISASESHNLANVNMTVEESLGKLAAVAEVAARAGKPVVAGISTSFGCPFEGAVPLERLVWLCGRLAALGGRGIGDEPGDQGGQEQRQDPARPAHGRLLSRAVTGAAGYDARRARTCSGTG